MADSGYDSPIVLHPSVWNAAGHVSNFTDPLVECKVLQIFVRFRLYRPVTAMEGCVACFLRVIKQVVLACVGPFAFLR